MRLSRSLGLVRGLLVLSLLVVAAAAPVAPMVPVRAATTATTQATTPVRTLQTGVEVFSMWRDWEVNAAVLDRVAAAGSGWARIGVGWCSLEERGPGLVSTWYQDRLDATVAEAEQRGLALLVTLGCTPTWAGGDDGYKVLPTDTAQYQRVAEYLAARYRGRVRAWEIWNEPDCVTGTCAETAPAAYLPVLRAGRAGVKAGDPAATVVSGGISGANADWVRRLYQAGGKGLFDALALHPYQGPAAEPPEAPPAEHPYRIANVEQVRQVMVDAGDGATPIWFTEFGWTTGGGTGWSAGVDEATQADYLRRAVELIQDRYPYVTHAFWFTVRDRDDWTPYENQFGLLRLDGTPKPAYTALVGANAWLRSLSARRTVVLPAVADTVVREQYPSASGGSSIALVADAREVDGKPRTRVTSYVRFTVPQLAPGETVSRASLVLHVTDGTVDGPTVWRTRADWLEASTTWKAGRPSRIGSVPVADAGRLLPGRVEVPLGTVPSPGAASYELHAMTSDALHSLSREAVDAADRPQLVLEISRAPMTAASTSRRGERGGVPARKRSGGAR